MSSILEVIQNAIRDASAVSIVYNGGSRPGQSRLLIPISVTLEDLIARDPAATVAKRFKLQKIASAHLASGEAASNLDAAPVPVALTPMCETFEEYAAHFRSFIGGARYNITEDKNYFAITGFFKNGKPRKTPVASIQFVDRSVESVFNFETGEFEEFEREPTGRERPWRVESALMKEGKAFTHLSKAAESFLQQVQACIQSMNDA